MQNHAPTIYPTPAWMLSSRGRRLEAPKRSCRELLGSQSRSGRRNRSLQRAWRGNRRDTLGNDRLSQMVIPSLHTYRVTRATFRSR